MDICTVVLVKIVVFKRETFTKCQCNLCVLFLHSSVEYEKTYFILSSRKSVFLLWFVFIFNCHQVSHRRLGAGFRQMCCTSQTSLHFSSCAEFSAIPCSLSYIHPITMKSYFLVLTGWV